MIYFFEILGLREPQVKIGFTRKSVAARLIQSITWADCRVLCVVPEGDLDDECFAHEALAPLRINAERFALTPRLREMLVTMSAGRDWHAEVMADLARLRAHRRAAYPRPYTARYKVRAKARHAKRAAKP